MASTIAKVGVGSAIAGLVSLALSISTPLIQKNEGLSLKPTTDVGTTQMVCYGHDGVPKQSKYTVAQCQALLQQDEAKVTTEILGVTPALVQHPNSMAATIDFVYNVGSGAYSKGSVARNFKAGHYKAGCAAMKKYVFVEGKFNKGLADRRQTEYNLCVKGL